MLRSVISQVIVDLRDVVVALNPDMKPNGHLLLGGEGDMDDQHVEQEHVADPRGFVEKILPLSDAIAVGDVATFYAIIAA